MVTGGQLMATLTLLDQLEARLNDTDTMSETPDITDIAIRRVREARQSLLNMESELREAISKQNTNVKF